MKIELEKESIQDRLKEKDAEIERLKKRLALDKILLTHAADALERWTITPSTQAFLVDALRKAVAYES